MAKGFVGNRPQVADSHEQLFGGPAFVAASLFGDGLWTNIGLVIRVEISRTIFSQTVSNEVMQRMGQSSFQAFATANISMTLRQFQVEHMAALYPGISKDFQPIVDDDEDDARNEGFGHSINASVIQPVGLHIRPQSAMGQPANNGTCWWIPAAVASEELGTFIYKLENTNEANEDYTLTFGASLLDQDYSPDPQTIADGGYLQSSGRSSADIVKGTPGRVDTFGVRTGTLQNTSATVEWTAPGNDYIDDDNPITGYRVLLRNAGSTGAFTTMNPYANSRRASRETFNLTANTVATETAPERAVMARFSISRGGRYTLDGTNPSALIGTEFSANTNTEIKVNAGDEIKFFVTGGNANGRIDYWENSFPLTNLTSGTAYEVRVYAQSAAGDGQQASMIVTTT